MPLNRTQIDINSQTQGELLVNRIDPGATVGYVLTAGASGGVWASVVIPTVPVLSVDGRTGNVNLSDLYTPLSTGITSGQTASWNYIAANGVTFGGLTAALDNYLPLAGGTLTGNLYMGANKVSSFYVPLAGDDLVNKTALDNAITGLQWRAPAEGFNLLGIATVADISTVTPVLGDEWVISGSGVLSGLTVSNGDVVEYQGPSAGWTAIDYHNGGGFVDADSRFIIAGTGRVIPGITGAFTQGVDNGKIVAFNGISDTPIFTSDATAQSSILVSYDGDPSDAVSIFDNSSYVFQGTVPSGSWIQFNGASQIVPGPGLYKFGNTIGITLGGIVATMLDAFITADIAEGVSANNWIVANSTDLVHHAGLTVALSDYLPLSGGTLTGDLVVEGTVTVNGFKMATGATAGYIFETDAFGNASWVAPDAASGITAGEIANWNYIFENGVTLGQTASWNYIVANGVTLGQTGPWNYIAQNGVTLGQTGPWNSVFTQVGTIVIRDVPQGTTGDSFSFEFSHHIMTNTEEVFLNGLLQEPFGEDYTMYPTGGVGGVSKITFVEQPEPLARIRANYRY